MRPRRLALVGGVALAALTLSGMSVAHADGGVGFSSITIGRGMVDHFGLVVIVPGTDVVTAQNTVAVGGASGWHSHPGMVVIAVQSGQITLHVERVGGGPCLTQTYSAGQVFYELPWNEQDGVNDGTTDTVLAVTFFNVPHGGSPRIDRDPPTNCS
jgi:quercetin dioxygenase-like cupin family protein